MSISSSPPPSNPSPSDFSPSDPLFVFVTYGGSTAHAAQWFYGYVPHVVIRAPFPPSREPSPHDPVAPPAFRVEPSQLPVTISLASVQTQTDMNTDLAGAVRWVREAAITPAAAATSTVERRPVVLIYPSYGAKPPFVARFLLRVPGLISAVAIAGNRTFGRGFCASARRFRSIPVLHTFEVSGTREDAERIISAARLLS